MQTYLDLLQQLLDQGHPKSDRTGTGTRSLFGLQTRYDLSPQGPGFPLLTTKKVHFKSVVYELLWFLRGDTNVRYLQDHGVSIWNEWADDEGELGPVYGRQWRSFPKPQGGHVDQITQLLASLKDAPDSRRHLVVAWNPGEISDMALPPCHCLFQFYVSPPASNAPDARPMLSCQLYQRSADVFLGVPFNVASYALLTVMLAHVLDYTPHAFIHTFGDIHLYENHVNQAREQLQRNPKPLPRIKLNAQTRDLFMIDYEDIELIGYDPHPAIRAPVAV